MESKVYTIESYREIYRELFGVWHNGKGENSLGSYRFMLLNIKLNYTDVEGMATKLNELIMPYFEDIKANPNKVL